MQHSTTWQSKQKISPNLDHHWSKKSPFPCVQTNLVCPSGTRRFCKNDFDSSLESLTVIRVIVWRTWLESNYWLESRYHCHFLVRWAPICSKKSLGKCWISSDATLNRTGKPITRSEPTVLATVTWPSRDSTLTRLEKILHDSDSTKMTRAHHCP